jgi:hypothetical protein
MTTLNTENNTEMTQCNTCALREHRKELMCCEASHLGFALRRLLKEIPVFGKSFSEYECGWYTKDGDVR